MRHNQFQRWLIDRRFFYVWFWDWENEFKTGEAGPRLAVMDDFGNLVEAQP